ncbi:MAG TPA: DUF2147 domain-containing protein [Sphingobium sp.]|nr:DUF2147 domain-containing protein [Sphingobium sp.]
MAATPAIRHISRQAVLAALALLLSSACALASPIGDLEDGLWLNPGGSVAVRTHGCGDRLCGWIVWASAAAQSDARESGVAHLIGTQLLEDYRPDGRNEWTGTVYVPDMGRRFFSRIEQTAPQQLKIKGCVLGGLICRSQLWTRIERTPGA